jgi:hypothetical protein
MLKDPSHQSELLTQLLLNDRVDLLEAGNGAWSKVRNVWNGTEGWVLTGQYAALGEKEADLALAYIVLDKKDGLKVEAVELPGTFLYKPQDGAIQTDHLHFNEVTIRRVLEVYKEAPYMWGGITPFGIDCSGLSKMLYRYFGVPLTNFAAEQFLQGTALDFLQDARCGDLAFFENQDGLIHHVGILLNAAEIMHASETAGRVVVDRIDQEGIVSNRNGKRTHRLRIVRRLSGLITTKLG